MATPIPLKTGRPRPRASLVIAGIPAPKGSRTPGLRKDGSIYTRPASKREHPWVEQVAYAARANRPGGKTLEPPYEIELAFSMPRPAKPKYDWPTRGDIDKLERAVLDGLVRGGLILDDRHVTALRSSKCFAAPGAVGVYTSVA